MGSMTKLVKPVLIGAVTVFCLSGLTVNPKGAVMTWLVGVFAIETAAGVVAKKN